MNWLAKLFSALQFSLDVGGLKTRMVLALGDALLSKKGQTAFNLHEVEVKLPPQSLLRLWRYAPDNIQRTYAQSALWGYVMDHVPDNGRFIDVGSNIGGYLVEANLLGLETIGVEPHPELGPALNTNRELFAPVHSVALSDAPGVLPFHLSDANPGGSSLVVSDAGWEASGYSRTVEVEVTTFDALFGDRLAQWDRIDLIKIDVEGAEEGVVRGMAHSLATGKIQAVWCEVRGASSDRNPNSALRVTELLNAHGYTAYHFDRMSDQPWRRFNPDSSHPQYFDLLYVRQRP